jgi:type VI secretion system protein ImpF
VGGLGAAAAWGAATAAAGAGRALSPRQYRASVLRDLRWLLNSQAAPAVERIEEFPEVAASVLNYGLPDLASRTVSGLSDVELERMIARAIERFEPRIIRQSLSVRVSRAAAGTADQPGIIEVTIEGEIWALPAPEAIFIRTEIDLGIGSCNVVDR